MKLNQLTIIEAREGLKRREFTVTDLVTACLVQIKERNKVINAFITVCEKEALVEAKKSDKLLNYQPSLPRRQAGIIDNQPLFGIPFSMKDVYMTKGIRTTAGSKVLENHVASYDAAVYKRLKEAGAILIGKTNCDAWGHGSSTENSDFGVTRNPWNLKYVAGGSSGGAAVAVADNMSLFDIGEDTGGSIRLPASFCSVVGLKVTYGLVSRYGAIAYASSLDTVGPIAKNVKDCALILEIIAGNDKHDATSTDKKIPKYTECLEKNIKGFKIGIPKEYFGKGVKKEVLEKIEKAVKKFENMGLKIKEVSLPMTKYAISTYYLIAPSETSSNLLRYDGIRFGGRRTNFGQEAKRRIMLGTFALSAGYYDRYYIKATEVRSLIKKDFEKVLDEVDIILAPVSPTPAFKIGEKVSDPLKMYLSDIFTISINLAGIPSLAIPCGFSKDGLPIGMQIVGKHFDEAKILNVAYQFEKSFKNEIATPFRGSQ